MGLFPGYFPVGGDPPGTPKVEEFSACSAQCVLLAIMRSLRTSSEPVDGFDSFGKENPRGKDPSYHKGAVLPGDRIAWTDATTYCSRIGMRLPTESEWNMPETEKLRNC